MSRRVKSADVAGDVKLALILPDMHVKASKKGGLDYRTWDAVIRFADDHVWDYVVLLGDVMDLNVISSHNNGKPRLVEGERLQAEFEETDEVLLQVEQAAPQAQKVWVEGNHEFRLTRYINVHPELEGALSVPQTLQLRKRGWKWVPFWSEGAVYELGKLTCIHGVYTNKEHAAKHLREYQCNLVYGHVHDRQAASMTARGDNKTHTAQSLGTLSVYDPQWMRGKPNKWQQAFAEAAVFPDGFFNLWVTDVFKHRFMSGDGVVYQG